jgi:hypothetical protein
MCSFLLIDTKCVLPGGPILKNSEHIVQFNNSPFFFLVHRCTVHLDAIKVFYLPTDAQ